MTITSASLYAELTAASLWAFIFALLLVAFLCLSCEEISEALFRICAVQRPITSRQLGCHVSTADSAQPTNVTRPFPACGWGETRSDPEEVVRKP